MFSHYNQSGVSGAADSCDDMNTSDVHHGLSFVPKQQLQSNQMHISKCQNEKCLMRNAWKSMKQQQAQQKTNNTGEFGARASNMEN